MLFEIFNVCRFRARGVLRRFRNLKGVCRAIVNFLGKNNQCLVQKWTLRTVADTCFEEGEGVKK